MLLHTSSSTLNSKTGSDRVDANSQSSPDATPSVAKSWTPKWPRLGFGSLRISQKIGYGYAIAVGIAILGTGAGLVIGEHCRRQALEQLKIATQQEELLNQLQMTVLEARSHASRLPAVIGNSVWLSYENSQFNENVATAKGLISKIERFVDKYPQQLATNSDKFRDLLKTYSITINYFSQRVELLLKETDPWNLKPEQIQPAQQQLLRSYSGEESIVLDKLSIKLNQLISAARTQEQKAAVGAHQAELLRVGIISLSILLSACVAVAMAAYTSRAIARPLESVTKVAQQAAQESNFMLQAPVTTQDEVGVLAASLNQLIQRVADYTQELKQAQTHLIQTEKMSGLGQMVAGVAHEINNPVNFIYGNLNHASEYIQELIDLLNLYQQHYPHPNSEIQDYIKTIELDFIAEDLPKIFSSMKVGADRIRQIVLSLRNFSRLDEAERKPVNLHEGIDSTLLILHHRLKDRIEIVKKYEDLLPVECYPAQLNQVFMNILSNAIDAVEELQVKGLQPVPPSIWIMTKLIDSRWIQVRIRDNGPGMTPDIKNKIFDPFFTTKPVGKGTGLGLAICYQIVEKHRGRIDVNSQLGQGTEFVITLPVA